MVQDFSHQQYHIREQFGDPRCLDFLSWFCAKSASSLLTLNSIRKRLPPWFFPKDQVPKMEVLFVSYTFFLRGPGRLLEFITPKTHAVYIMVLRSIASHASFGVLGSPRWLPKFSLRSMGGWNGFYTPTFHGVHPWRWTWNIIMEVWKVICLSKWVICRFHVNLPGCICSRNCRVLVRYVCVT